MTEQLLIAGRILCGQEFRPGRVVIEDGRVRAVELGKKPGSDGYVFPDGYVGPGLIDLQLNGALGHDLTADPRGLDAVARFLPSTGVTAFLPTVVTAPPEVFRTAVAGLRQKDGRGAAVLGIHLEGPYLNALRAGAHDARALRMPSLPEMVELLAAGGGRVRIVTLAPELPGADQLIHYLRANGVVVSGGHSDATYEQAVQAFEAGVTWVTHIFNAQPPLHHRAPGLAGAALARAGLRIGLIADGLHVHPAMCALVYRCKGAVDITLVSDGVSALGLEAGEYGLAGWPIRVVRGVARTPDGRLAGSMVSLNAAVRNMMSFAGASRAEAWRMASTTPAALLGLADRGDLRPGAIADVAVMSADMEPLLTLCAGQVAYSSSPAVAGEG